MAFYVGTTNYFTGTTPSVSSAAIGSPLVAASSSSVFWAYPGASQTTPGNALLTRSILTHGFTAGGYKDSIAWRSVNKTWHSTDTTIPCGEQLDLAAGFCAGTWSDYSAFVHGTTNGTIGTASTHTSSYSLSTGVQRIINLNSTGANPGGPFGYTGKDPFGDGQGVAYGTSASNLAGGAVYQATTAGIGSSELSVARSYFAGTQNQVAQVGYISGGSQSTNTDKFYFPTEIMYTTTANGMVTPVANTTAAGGATGSYWSFGGTNKQLSFSSDTWSAWSAGVNASPDGQTKMMSTKVGWHYAGTSSIPSTATMKYSDATGITLSAVLYKPTSLGEENMQTGQNWGYCLGSYTGLQSNYTYKLSYTTDITTVLGTAAQPKGHVGSASATTSSAAALVTMGNI